MENQFVDTLLHYAARLSDGTGTDKAQHYAIAQGWLNEDGQITPEGRKTAEAFIDQEKNRSAFRIG